MPFRFNSILILLAAALIGQAASAQPAPTVAIQVSAAKKIVVAGADGKLQTAWQPLASSQASVVPGDILRYKMISVNHLPHILHGFALTQPVPPGTEYMAQSAVVTAGGETVLTISIDGGSTFSLHPVIAVKNSGGTVSLEPAPVSRYTQPSPGHFGPI